jgi:hypothetical protein
MTIETSALAGRQMMEAESTYSTPVKVHDSQTQDTEGEAGAPLAPGNCLWRYY